MRKLFVLLIIIISLSQCEKGPIVTDKAKLLPSSISDIEKTNIITFKTCNNGNISFKVLQNWAYANGWYEIKYETYPVNNLVYLELTLDTVCRPYN